VKLSKDVGLDALLMNTAAVHCGCSELREIIPPVNGKSVLFGAGVVYESQKLTSLAILKTPRGGGNWSWK